MALKLMGVCAAKNCCHPAISTLGFCQGCVSFVCSMYQHAESAEKFIKNFMDQSTFVYFVYASAPNAIKIGQSKRVEGRLKELQTAMPGKIDILTCMRARPKFEQYCHEYFSEFRTNNEWFSLSKPLVDVLVGIADGAKHELLQHGSIDLEKSAKNYGLWLMAKINGSEIWG